MLDDLAESRKSLIRWGDADTCIAIGEGMFYQQADAILRKGLLRILEEYSSSADYMLAIPDHFATDHLFKLPANRWLLWASTRRLLRQKLGKNVRYGDAFFFRNMVIGSDGISSPDSVVLWQDMTSVVCVHSHSSDEIARLNLFPTQRTFHIPIPSTNAGALLDATQAKVLDVIRENSLTNRDTAIVVSGGPMAKVLVFNLTQLGYRSFDVGYLFNPEPIKRKFGVA